MEQVTIKKAYELSSDTRNQIRACITTGEAIKGYAKSLGVTKAKIETV